MRSETSSMLESIALKPQESTQLSITDLRARGLLGIPGKKSLPLRIISLLWLVASIVLINVLGMKNQQVSNKYHLYVTPPSFFFIIWALIFGLQVICNIINVIRDYWTIREHILLAVNNALLIAWSIVFDIGTDVSVFSSFVILYAVIPLMLHFWRKIGQLKVINWFTYLTRNTYAFYLGWIVAATNLNLGMIIVYSWKASHTTQMVIFWIMAPLCAIGITLLNLHLEGVFGLKSCLALWASVIWAFVGAAIQSHKCLHQGCL